MSWDGPNRKNYITTGTTTQVTTAGVGSWVLEGIQLWAESTGTIKIYDDDDGTSGIFVDLPIGAAAGAYPMSIACAVGIRVVTSAADKVLVVYRKI